jgi:L-asparaginase
MRRIALISTGGTIEKTYDDLSGVLANQISVLDIMLASLELRGVTIQRIALMNKDSLEMSADDHTLIAETATRLARETDGVVVVHGTDRLSISGERVVELAGTPATPIVFTSCAPPTRCRTSPRRCSRSSSWLLASTSRCTTRCYSFRAW